MKKISIALASLLMTGSAMAVDFTVSNSVAEQASTSSAQTVRVVPASGSTLFIVNPFNFTMSAGVGVGAIQDAANLVVGAGAAKGRTIYSGHSNGGSVSQCGTQTTAGDTATPDTLAGDRLSLTKVDGCSTKADIVAAGS